MAFHFTILVTRDPYNILLQYPKNTGGSVMPICAMIKSRYIGDGHPTFNRNPYNGYINPYYWVDDHPLLYGNNGSLDPGTYKTTHQGFEHCPIGIFISQAFNSFLQLLHLSRKAAGEVVRNRLHDIRRRLKHRLS